MKKIKFIMSLVFLSSSLLLANDLELENIFKEKKVEGTIVIESLNKKNTYIHNRKRAETLLIPASTFKIPNTLIALNEKVIDKNSLIFWDKKDKGLKSWNKDQTLQTAYKNSCVWCYQEFASKIGIDKYKGYLKILDYGNKNIGNDVKEFWLDGSLKITAFEEINFLKQLHKNELPFKIEDINTLKEIMVEEKNEDFIIRAKTGWATRIEPQNGWYVGYVETKNGVWFFATNIIIKSEDDLVKRKEITFEALKIKGII